MLAQMLTRCGRDPGFDEPPEPGHQGDGHGGEPDRHDTPMMIQIALVAARARQHMEASPAAKPMAARNNRLSAIQLAVDTMAPELSAAAASYPRRWKNLTRTVNTAMSPPTREVKVFEVSSARHRPNGSWPGTAPMSAHASETTGSWANRKASATQPQLAPLMTSSDPAASPSTPRMAQTPISEPAPNTRLAQLIRLASASLGTSMPVALATAARSWGSSFLSCCTASTVTGSRPERWRWTRAPRAVSASSTRPAAAAARSVPTRTAIAASTAARSPSRRASGADEDARRKFLRPTSPAAERMSVSEPSAPCAMPAARSRSTVSSSSSRVASARLAWATSARTRPLCRESGHQGRVVAGPESARRVLQAPGRRRVLLPG